MDCPVLDVRETHTQDLLIGPPVVTTACESPGRLELVVAETLVPLVLGASGEIHVQIGGREGGAEGRRIEDRRFERIVVRESEGVGKSA